MRSGALFSDDRRFRFMLYRIWKEDKAKVMFIGLNPSTANEKHDDPTIKRVIKFAASWGFGGVYMTNLFPFVSASPSHLKTFHEHYKDENYKTLREVSKKCEMIVFAWGNFKEAKEREKEVYAMFTNVHVLGLNANGSPKHPLYIKGDTKPGRFGLWL